jgi:hypothetical protein
MAHSRQPFVDELAIFLEASPSPAVIRKFANRSPDTAPSFAMRLVLMNSVVSPSTTRSIRSAAARTIADEQLVFQRQRLRGDGTDATWAEKLREGDQ